MQTVGGDVLGCGSTEHGQLGVAPPGVHSITAPQPISIQVQEVGMQPALAVACGDHTLVVCCLQASFPGCLSTLHTCNTALSIPDLLALAKAARPLSGSAPSMQEPGSQAQALIDLSEAVSNVFSSPGLLLSGFSMPQAPRAAYDNTAVRSEGQLNLDLGAIKDVYDSILLVLNPDVVLALQTTIATLLKRIYEQEEMAASQGRVSALQQAQWLKVCSDS